MKIAVITFHANLNNGAFLQAYALQTFLSDRMNVHTDLLNYQTEKQKQLSSVFLPVNSVSDLVRNFIAVLHYKKLKERETEYKMMQKKYLHLTRPLSSFQDFKTMYGEYDVFISGSDQIWNGTLNGFSGGGQEPYFLKDCPKRKISYATSIGPNDSPELRAVLEQNKKSIEEYAAVSVRESLAEEVVKNYTDQQIKVVLDPVFLLSKEDYKPLFDHRLTPKERYILLYSVNYPLGILQAAAVLSAKTNLPVLVPYAGRRAILCHHYHFKVLYNAGPGCFLDLLYHAEVVLTDSFHGTAFSILFEKEFFCFRKLQEDDEDRDSRIQTLLDTAGLSYRYLTKWDDSILAHRRNASMCEKMKKEIVADREWLRLAIIDETIEGKG